MKGECPSVKSNALTVVVVVAGVSVARQTTTAGYLINWQRVVGRSTCSVTLDVECSTTAGAWGWGSLTLLGLTDDNTVNRRSGSLYDPSPSTLCDAVSSSTWESSMMTLQ